jgi:hypothetical protein
MTTTHNSYFNYSMPNSALGNIGELIAKKYRSRDLTPSDPAPITIDCDTKGPLNVAGGFIMCDGCGHIIRGNYLPSHKSSGACDRIAEKKRREQKNLPRPTQIHTSNNPAGPIPGYDGPFVCLSDSSTPSWEKSKDFHEASII